MKRKTKYTKELLEPIVAVSFSTAEVIRKLGLRCTGGNYKMIAARIKLNGIDTTHFTGQGHLKGKTHNFSRTSDEKLFAENTFFRHSTYKKRLIEIGWKYECSICFLTEWLGNQITLHIDHINGESTDNRLENLRFLCPNCYQQTDTWGNTKPKKVPIVKEKFIKPKKVSDPNWRVRDRTHLRKVERPTKEELEVLLSSKSWVEIGRTFGVSDNAVRKWARRYKI
jgi:hypothetical protein